ncbi:hypothetical protein Clacol_009675 [Clathrus columnatus]|uniref:Uncharacterized protein n=1 Tax=Clathrus columnatus TaxID=1419009 RepID=A0AAV5ARM5_9AGAM|nr:hypothetical protein Clacol_009675 [Clathrus columnatus]
MSVGVDKFDLESFDIPDILTTPYGFYGFYNLCAVVTVLAVDIFETFNRETTTGIAARTLTLSYCIPWFVVLASTQYLFTIRTLALNARPRWLYYLLMGTFVGRLIGGLVLFLVYHPPSSESVFSQAIVAAHAGNFKLPLSFTDSVARLGVSELAFQSILVLAIIGTIVRHQKTWTLRQQRSLTSIIIRDGLWGYFFNHLGLIVVIVQPIWLVGPAGQPSIQ